jgi:spore maturation protein CgeB
MKILFIGVNNGNSKFTYNAIKKTYPQIKFLDTSKILNNFYYKIFYHISPIFFNQIISNFYKKKITKFYDLVFFFNVEFINEDALKTIKKFSKRTYYYCADNPFVTRDKQRWTLIKKIISKFNFIIFHQKSREKYVGEYKIKKFITIIPPYFKDIHIINGKENIKKNIVFVGSWFPERGKFFYELKKKGFLVDIFGPHWDKDKKYYKYLKEDINLKDLSPREVAKTINKYKIAIGLLSKENEDDITNRCIEIPATGSLLCSERTATLKKILIENKEAVYFNNPNECIKKCNKLLNNPKLRIRIARKGHNKIVKVLRPEAERVFRKLLNPSCLEKNTNKFIYKF